MSKIFTVAVVAFMVWTCFVAFMLGVYRIYEALIAKLQQYRSDRRIDRATIGQPTQYLRPTGLYDIYQDKEGFLVLIPWEPEHEQPGLPTLADLGPQARYVTTIEAIDADDAIQHAQMMAGYKPASDGWESDRDPDWN